MIKDINQKLKAIRYSVALGIVPHLEVLVRFSSEVSDKPSDITDIDVLGIKPCDDKPSYRTLFDCKTLNKMSPINRALWAKGLLELTKSDEAFVILTKATTEGHRLAGNSLGVRLFSEKLFDSFASAAAKDYAIQNSYLENLRAWESLANIPTYFPALADLWGYLTSSALLETNGTHGLRSLMSNCKRIEGELDPSKDSHRALFKLILVQFCLYISEMVRDFNNIYSAEMNKKEFEKIVRYYIWGGKENYELRKRLKDAIHSGNGTVEVEPFEFPAWNNFIELFHTFLEAPFLVGSVCLPLKDLAFRDVSTPIAELDRRLTIRLASNNRVKQFILASASYLTLATRVPREFKEGLSADLGIS